MLICMTWSGTLWALSLVPLYRSPLLPNRRTNPVISLSAVAMQGGTYYLEEELAGSPSERKADGDILFGFSIQPQFCLQMSAWTTPLLTVAPPLLPFLSLLESCSLPSPPTPSIPLLPSGLIGLSALSSPTGLPVL